MKDKFFNSQTGMAQILQRKYNGARSNLLLVFIFSVINIVLLVTNANRYFLFSASIPYMLTDIGMFFSGMYPEEFYAENFIEFEALPPAFFYVLLTVSIIIILFYLVSYIFSKNHAGWLIFSLAFFSADTLGMILYFGISQDMILDFIFHAMIIVSLSYGVHAHFKLKKLKAEEIPDIAPYGDPAITGVEIPNSPILRPAAETKARTFLSFESFGHNVVFRRVKRTNELVIDGNVYAEYIALMERSHELTAIVDGHEFTVGFEGSGSVYATVDRLMVAQKARFF